MNQLEEYHFYKQQLQQAKIRGTNSIAISVEFLDLMLNHTEQLQTIEQAHQALQKAL